MSGRGGCVSRSVKDVCWPYLYVFVATASKIISEEIYLKRAVV